MLRHSPPPLPVVLVGPHDTACLDNRIQGSSKKWKLMNPRFADKLYLLLIFGVQIYIHLHSALERSRGPEDYSVFSTKHYRLFRDPRLAMYSMTSSNPISRHECRKQRFCEELKRSLSLLWLSLANIPPRHLSYHLVHLFPISYWSCSPALNQFSSGTPPCWLMSSYSCIRLSGSLYHLEKESLTSLQSIPVLPFNSLLMV